MNSSQLESSLKKNIDNIQQAFMLAWVAYGPESRCASNFFDLHASQALDPSKKLGEMRQFFNELRSKWLAESGKKALDKTFEKGYLICLSMMEVKYLEAYLEKLSEQIKPVSFDNIRQIIKIVKDVNIDEIKQQLVDKYQNEFCQAILIESQKIYTEFAAKIKQMDSQALTSTAITLDDYYLQLMKNKNIQVEINYAVPAELEQLDDMIAFADKQHHLQISYLEGKNILQIMLDNPEGLKKDLANFKAETSWMVFYVFNEAVSATTTIFQEFLQMMTKLRAGLHDYASLTEHIEPLREVQHAHHMQLEKSRFALKNKVQSDITQELQERFIKQGTAAHRDMLQALITELLAKKSEVSEIKVPLAQDKSSRVDMDPTANHEVNKDSSQTTQPILQSHSVDHSQAKKSLWNRFISVFYYYLSCLLPGRVRRSSSTNVPVNYATVSQHPMATVGGGSTSEILPKSSQHMGRFAITNDTSSPTPRGFRQLFACCYPKKGSDDPSPRFNISLRKKSL